MIGTRILPAVLVAFVACIVGRTDGAPQALRERPHRDETGDGDDGAAAFARTFDASTVSVAVLWSS